MLFKSATLAAIASASLLAGGLYIPVQAATPRCAGNIATIVGTSGSDELHGTSRRDVIAALGGDDRVRGSRGADLICGGGGRDGLVGGPGDDVLRGEALSDYLDGGLGTDDLRGGSGVADRLRGGSGRDDLRGGGGPNDWVSYESGPVHVDLFAGKAWGDGRDRLRGVENISGSGYSDTLIGNFKDNKILEDTSG